MAPVEPQIPKHSKKQLFRVLVTGFGPFRAVVVNPSHLLAQALDGCVLETEDLLVVISAYGPPVTTEYSCVTALVPRLHDFSWDLVLHIGSGLPGKVALESLGHKSGYDKRGVMNELPAQGAASAPSNFPEELHSALPLADIVARVEVSRASSSSSSSSSAAAAGAAAAPGGERHAPSVPLVVSNDAGHFLCDFIFYTSLAEEAKRQAGRVVQFLHIPPLPDRIQQQHRASQSAPEDTHQATEPSASSSKAEVQSFIELLRSKSGHDVDKSERYPFDEVLQVTKSIVWHIACSCSQRASTGSGGS